MPLVADVDESGTVIALIGHFRVRSGCQLAFTFAGLRLAFRRSVICRAEQTRADRHKQFCGIRSLMREKMNLMSGKRAAVPLKRRLAMVRMVSVPSSMIGSNTSGTRPRRALGHGGIHLPWQSSERARDRECLVRLRSLEFRPLALLNRWIG